MIGKLRTWWTRTGAFAREIVAKRATIVTGSTTIAGALVTFGVIPVDLSTKGLGIVLGGLGVLQAIVTVFWARRGTTPSDPALQPTDDDGRRLVPAGSVAAATIKIDVVGEPAEAASAVLRKLDTSTSAKHDATGE